MKKCDLKEKKTKNNLNKMRWVYMLLQLIIGMATSFTYVLSVYVGPLHEARGWSVQQILLTFTVAMWVGPISTIIGGKIRDTWGNKVCLIGGGVLYGISVMISGLVSNVTLFILLQGGLTAFFMYCLYLAQIKNVSNLFPEMRATALGILRGGTSLFSGALPVIGVALMGITTVTAAIVIQGAAFSIICLVCGLLIYDPPEALSSDTVDTSDIKADTEKLQTVERNWRQMIREPSFYLIALAVALLGMTSSMIQSNLVLITQNATGAGDAKAAGVVTMSVIVLGLGGIGVGFAADRLGNFRVLTVIAAIVMVTFGCILIIGVQHFYPFVTAVMIICLMAGGVAPLIPVICMDSYGDRHFGVNMGVLGVPNLLVTLIAPQLSASLPVPVCFAICGGLAGLDILIICMARNSINKMKEGK